MRNTHPSTSSSRTASRSPLHSGVSAVVLAVAAAMVVVVSAVVAVVGSSVERAAAAPVTPLPVLDTWAWCGVHPDDPVALASARSMAVAAGIDVTFGPCNVPTPDYTPANTANRYVDPQTYARLVAINASVGMKTVVYDARLWSDTAAVRNAAIAFWQPQLADIAAWDMGDEFDHTSSEWAVLIHRWDVVRAHVTPVTGITPYTNLIPSAAAVNAALRDLSGSEQLVSFAQYGGDLGVSLARSFDASVRTVMCGVNAFTHFQFRPTAARIRADMTVLRAAGCDRMLVFGGQRVYGTDLFGGPSLAENDGTATSWAGGVLEGTGRSSYTPVGPSRILETRVGDGLSTIDGQFQGVGVRGAGSVTRLTVVGRAGVPMSAGAVALTITATEARAPGFVTVYPCDDAVPNASQLNYAVGSTVSASVVAKVASGWVCLFTSSDIDVAVDVAGYYPEGSPYVPTAPARLLETRVGEGLSTADGRDNGIGVRVGGSITVLQVTGRGGVPVSAGAAVLSVTTVDARAPGFVTVFPCGEPQVPTASTSNYRPGVVSTNAVVTALDTAGQVCLYTSADVDMVVDVNGHHPLGSTTVPISPVRLLDTRTGPGLTTVDRLSSGIGKRVLDTVTELQVAGRGGLPADVGSVILNLTVTETSGPGFVTVFPCGAGRPNASSINFAAGSTLPNLVITDLDSTGKVCFYTMVGTHLVVDVTAVHR